MTSRTDIAAGLAITISVIAGLLQLSAWAIVLGACGLTMLSILRKHEAAVLRLGGSASVHAVLLLSSAINASAISALGYAAGATFRAALSA